MNKYNSANTHTERKQTDCEKLAEPRPLLVVSTGLFIAVPYASCHSFQHNDRETDCSSVPSTMLPASQKPMGWDSNIELAEGHKYWQCSAIQLQPNDIWWNVERQRCRSPFATIVGTSPLFHPLINFFKWSLCFDLVSTDSHRRDREDEVASCRKHGLERWWQLLSLPA